MTPQVDVLIPTLWRSDRLAKLVDNIHQTTVSDHVVTFVIEATDPETWNAVEALMVNDDRVRRLVNDRAMNLPGAINSAMPHIEAPWWFLSNDDVKFYPRWDVAALAVADAHPGARVIGTNDLHNPYVLAGIIATQPFVSTAYIAEFGGVADVEPGVAVTEEYRHNFIDVELCEEARNRGVWQPCLDAVVEHLHWSFGFCDRDATYEKSWQDGEVERHDRAVWARRKWMFPQCQIP
jgi:hypothetical protein